MDPMAMTAAKYEAMARETTEHGRTLVHDAANCAMLVVCSEYGSIRMLGRFSASTN